MSASIAFLTVDDVLIIHERMIAEFGGTTEVRDHGLLHSAVHMPQAQFGGKYLHDGLAAMAAAYLFHICGNHPFVDGNKRTALASAEMFVLINRASLLASNEELETLTMSVAEGRCSKERVTAFMRNHVSTANA